MGKTLISVNCLDQRLFVLNNPIVASGGRNEDEIEFNFCQLWDGFEKTAVFFRDKSAVYHIPIVDDKCVIPHEVLSSEGWLYFGVFGVKDDLRRTSEIMKYHIVKGAITEGGLPTDPTADVYKRYLDSLANMEQTTKDAATIIADASEAATRANTAAESAEAARDNVRVDVDRLSEEMENITDEVVNLNSKVGRSINPGNIFPKADLSELATTATVGLPYSTTGVLVENVENGVNGVSLPSAGNLGFLLEIDNVASGVYTFSVCRSGASAYNGRCVLQYLNANLGGLYTENLDALTSDNPVWETTVDVENVKASYPGAAYLRVLFGNTSPNTVVYSKPVMIIASVENKGFMVDNIMLYKPKFSPLYGKKIALDGDSITAGDGFKGAYGKIIGERYNMIVQNNAVGGATLATGTLNTDGVSNRHWVSDSISALDADADYVLISAFVNDFWNAVPLGELTVNKYNSALDDTTVIGAVERICRELIARFPGKKVGFVLTHSIRDWYRKDCTGTPSDTASMTNYHDGVISALKKYSIPYCDLYNISGFPTEIDSLRLAYTKNGDGTHPTEEGYRLFYVDKIIAFLESL